MEAMFKEQVTSLIKTMNVEQMGPIETTESKPSLVLSGVDDTGNIPTAPKKEPKLGRNDPCYCGSGKKYKNCHGKE
jgi:preprotein translocase subunit SecA